MSALPAVALLKSAARTRQKVKPPAGPGRRNPRRRRPRRKLAYVRRDQFAALLFAMDRGQLPGKEALPYRKLGPRTLLEHAVVRLNQCVGSVYVAVPEAEIEAVRKLLGKKAEVFAGSATPVATLGQFLEICSSTFLMIHDVAWPFASPRLIHEVGTAAMEGGAAVAADFPPASAAVGEDLRIVPAPGAGPCVLPQSPGAFHRDDLRRAVEAAAEAPVQSAWEAARLAGIAVAAVENDERNFRITTQLDWAIASRVVWPLVRQRSSIGKKA